jgi:hypothetical protein
MTGDAKNTVTKLSVDLGTACSVQMDRQMRDLPCETLRVDETHQSLGGKTPAMAAGLEDHVWKVEELIALLSAVEATPIKRGAYGKTRELKAAARGEEISD